MDRMGPAHDKWKMQRGSHSFLKTALLHFHVKPSDSIQVTLPTSSLLLLPSNANSNQVILMLFMARCLIIRETPHREYDTLLWTEWE